MAVSVLCRRCPAGGTSKAGSDNRRRSVLMVLCLSPYPWDCVALTFRRSIVLRALGFQRLIFFAVGVDLGARALGWK